MKNLDLKQNPLANEDINTWPYIHIYISIYHMAALSGIDLVSHVTGSARQDERSDPGPS